MTIEGTYDTLIVETIRCYIYLIVKGKPFERVGHKALEPKSPTRLMVVSCQKGERI